jgi:protein-S-isoprenylcysteine O-methyltransferase Ste14
MSGLAVATLVYHVASRLAYVLYIATALTLERRRRSFTLRWGVAEGFRRFRRSAALLMNNDAVSFVVLAGATRGTLRLEPAPAVLLIGAGLCVVGVATKLWAARTLGIKAYYWYDFFAGPQGSPSRSGPYRLLRNPMYTVGYVQTYGLALLLQSAPALAAGLFDQLAILAFHRWVERPYVKVWASRGTLA